MAAAPGTKAWTFGRLWAGLRNSDTRQSFRRRRRDG